MEIHFPGTDLVPNTQTYLKVLQHWQSFAEKPGIKHIGTHGLCVVRNFLTRNTVLCNQASSSRIAAEPTFWYGLHIISVMWREIHLMMVIHVFQFLIKNKISYNRTT